MPSLNTPGHDRPGYLFPGDVDVTELSATGVAVDATGTTTLGSVDGDRDIVVTVTVNPTAADFDFTVNADGDEVFTVTQSPADTSEASYNPDDEDNVVVDSTPTDIVFEVTDPSATGGATADVTVEVHSEGQRQ